MKVLITGGFGYIGSSIQSTVRFLEEECPSVDAQFEEIVYLDNFYWGQNPILVNNLRPKDKFVPGNICEYAKDRTFIQQFDAIIHLAALVGAPLCEERREEAIRVNFESVVNLVDSLRPDQKLIFPNTNSGYGSNPNVCTEETPLNPHSHYAKTKQLAEEYIRDHHPNHIIFRLATLFGRSYGRERYDLLINNLTYDAVFSGRIEVFNGYMARNYVSVHDVSKAMISPLCHDDFWSSLCGEVYNFGNDDLNCTKMTLAQKITDIVGCQPVKDIGQVEDPDRRDYTVSSAKWKNAIAMSPIPGFVFMNLEEGLEHTVKQLQKFKKFCFEGKEDSVRNLMRTFRNY